jgi:hypothetical protein
VVAFILAVLIRSPNVAGIAVVLAAVSLLRENQWSERARDFGTVHERG